MRTNSSLRAVVPAHILAMWLTVMPTRQCAYAPVVSSKTAWKNMLQDVKKWIRQCVKSTGKNEVRVRSEVRVNGQCQEWNLRLWSFIWNVWGRIDMMCRGQLWRPNIWLFLLAELENIHCCDVWTGPLHSWVENYRKLCICLLNWSFSHGG